MSPEAVGAPGAIEPPKTGAGRFLIGGWLGVLAGILAVDTAVVAIEIAVAYAHGVVPLDAATVVTASVLILVGNALYLGSIFFYRRGFVQLRRFDAKFWWATVLCLAGSLGFLLLIVSAIVVARDPSPVVACLHGPLVDLRVCLQTGLPLGEDAALVGLGLAWVGGAGISLGLYLSGRHLHHRWWTFAAVAYGAFLLALLIPFLASVFPMPVFETLEWLLPVLALAAPVSVLLGARAAGRSQREGESV